MNKLKQQKVLNIVGLAFRARKCVLGVDSIIEHVQKRRVHFVLIASDAKKNSKKKLIDKCNTYNVAYNEIANRELLGNAIGKQERVAIAILDKGFARKIQSLLLN